jgi:nitroreductase
MELAEAIYARRAVREFTAAPVDDDDIRKLIDAAIQAPSAVNEQPWDFCVVRDRALLAEISRDAKAYLMRNTPPGMESDHFRHMLSDSSFDIFYGAPALILISAATATPWAVEDCSLAAENLMLAARDLSLGTCWIGLAQSYLGTPEGRAKLGLSPSQIPVAPIIVGHPKTFPPPVTRETAKIRWIDPK